MNRLLIAILALAATLAHAAPQMLTKGIDLTGQSTVTASQLNQLVDSATIKTPYGIVIRTNGRPTLSAFSGHTNYLWYDTSVSPPSLRGYVCCGDADTNWVTATLGAGAVASGNLATPAVAAGQIFANGVVTSNLADNAVTDTKISAGAVVNSKIAGGAVSNANIALGTITGDKISTLTITDTNLAAGTITGGKLVNSTITSNQLAASTVNIANIAPGTAGAFLATTTGGSQVWTNAFAVSVTSGIAVPTGSTSLTNAHTLGSVPTIIQLRLVCGTADVGWIAGDEVDALTAISVNTGNPFFNVGANSANWYLSHAGSNVLGLRDRGTGATNAITKGNWSLKATLIKVALP